MYVYVRTYVRANAVSRFRCFGNFSRVGPYNGHDYGGREVHSELPYCYPVSAITNTGVRD